MAINKVGSKGIEDGAVAAIDLADETVSSDKLADTTIENAKLSNSSITAVGSSISLGGSATFNNQFVDWQSKVTSDGSIHPEEALKEAAKILIGHFVLFSDENIMPETKVSKVVEEVDETFLQMRKILKTPLADLDLSVRAYNCLKAAERKTLGELVNYHIEDLLKFRNFGKKSLSELEEFVRDRGLHFGMDVAKYNLNDD